MKYLLFPLLIIAPNAHAQKGIENDNGRLLYIGINNRLFAPAEKSKPGSMELYTDNGKVIKDTAHPGVFYLRPDHIGKASILINQWYTKNVVHNDSLNYEVIEK